MANSSTTQKALALHRAGDFDAAIGAYRKALSSEPENAMAWDGLGLALRGQGDLAAALKAGEAAVHHGPERAQGWSNRGNTHAAMGDDSSALADYCQAILLAPGYGEAWANRGMAEKRLGQRHDAVASFARAAELSAANAPALNHIGNLLFELEAFEPAQSCYQKAVAADSDFANGWNNLGNTRIQLLQLEPAITAFEQALACAPGHGEAGNGYAQALLMSGDYRRGWPAYEARFEKPGAPPQKTYDFPRWSGENLQGKTLYLHAEQGLGDTIQFLRFASKIKQRDARVILECPASLHRLAMTVDGIDQVVTSTQGVTADFHLPLMSVPCLLGLSSDADVAVSGPYITASISKTGTHPKTRVGLVWSGNPAHVNDHNRSMAFACLGPLLERVDVEFVSLQTGPAGAQMQPFDPHRVIADLGRGLADFTDTAAVLADLDLLITVDTSIAHLAGAMGRPCWLLLPYVPDWRWRTDGDATPWYPSLRLFRQLERGNWPEVIQRVGDALQSVNKRS
ncbi:MAG: glycosyltransferase family protein [Rhodospirillales bacterium]|nr:glycosyltransferase family protein [Rhodospirillales bacterium]